MDYKQPDSYAKYVNDELTKAFMDIGDGNMKSIALNINGENLTILNFGIGFIHCCLDKNRSNNEIFVNTNTMGALHFVKEF